MILCTCAKLNLHVLRPFLLDTAHMLWILRGIDTLCRFRETTSVTSCLLFSTNPFEKVSFLKGKNLIPRGTNSFF